ncbi:MAG: B12-binding domain-containing radical SAM protein [Candidatus Omnitrophota bacterium]
MIKKNILLVNPWIYDFAAYDLWLKPWGFLKIAAILKSAGFNTYFVDALDRHHPSIVKRAADHADGTGKYEAEEVAKPEPLKHIPRRYKRYGLPEAYFMESLPDENVDIALITSGMTYWYPGAFRAIRLIKDKYGPIPVVLGGVYATLAFDHARMNSGADHVLTNKNIQALSDILGAECDFSYENILDTMIDYSWYKRPRYGVLRVSLGCPFDCAYCAQKELSPAFFVKKQDKAAAEIKKLYDMGINKFAFYDDALLYDTEYITEYMSRIKKAGITASFYTPNGLHARFLTKKTARLMADINFVNPVLSLELSDDGEARKWHTKVTRAELERAVSYLNEAGYKKGQYTVYLMLGAPGIPMGTVMDSVRYTHSLGAKISLSEFSPIPGTKMAEPFKTAITEPLLQNNSVFPSFSISQWEEVNSIKSEARRLNAGNAG